MSLIEMSVKHGRTMDDARARLEQTVNEVRGRFGPLVQRVDWAPDHHAVTMTGHGFHVEMRVDPEEVHLKGDIPALGGILGGPLASGLKGILQKTFPKQLT